MNKKIISHKVNPQKAETDYEVRLALSTLLVIGATGYEHENEMFSLLDPNYIPVGFDYMCSSPIAGSPLTEDWETKGFWEKLSDNLRGHQFLQILIDGGTLRHAIHAEQQKIDPNGRRGWKIGDYELFKFVDYIISTAKPVCNFYLLEESVSGTVYNMQLMRSVKTESNFCLLEKLWINGFFKTDETITLCSRTYRKFSRK